MLARSWAAANFLFFAAGSRLRYRPGCATEPRPPELLCAASGASAAILRPVRGTRARRLSAGACNGSQAGGSRLIDSRRSKAFSIAAPVGLNEFFPFWLAERATNDSASFLTVHRAARPAKWHRTFLCSFNPPRSSRSTLAWPPVHRKLGTQRG